MNGLDESTVEVTRRKDSREQIACVLEKLIQSLPPRYFCEV